MSVSCTIAQNHSDSNSTWSVHTTCSWGRGSADRWSTSQPLFGGGRLSSSYTNIYQYDIGIGYQFACHWTTQFDIAYQHSVNNNSDNVSNYTQDYFLIAPSLEYSWKITYVTLGLFVAYEMNNPSLVEIHYPTGVVRPSQWNGGPLVSLGLKVPIGKHIGVGMGIHGTFGLLRYYNFSEQYQLPANDRKYDHLKIMPTYLFDLQLIYKL